LVCVSTAVALGVGEVAVRVFGLGPEIHAVYRENYRLSADAKLGYELVPGSPDRAFRINSDGMRDRERTLKKPPGTFRIACIGDSVTYGHAVGRAAAYPAQLEAILNRGQGSTAYEVLNFGVTGYDITQSVQNLRVRALAYEPDLVIYQYCLNDPETFSFEREGLLRELTRAQADYWERGSAAGRWVSRSRLAALFWYAGRSLGTPGRTRREVRPDALATAIDRGTWADYFTQLHADPVAWQRIESELDELRALTADEGIPAVVVVFPMLLELWRYPLTPVHEKVRRAAERRSFATLDLLPAFQEAEARGLRATALHPNARGHAVAAHAIARFVAQRRRPAR
jgi:lysophospholipase L1-like esterase